MEGKGGERVDPPVVCPCVCVCLSHSNCVCVRVRQVVGLKGLFVTSRAISFCVNTCTKIELPLLIGEVVSSRSCLALLGMQIRMCDVVQPILDLEIVLLLPLSAC